LNFDWVVILHLVVCDLQVFGSCGKLPGELQQNVPCFHLFAPDFLLSCTSVLAAPHVFRMRRLLTPLKVYQMLCIAITFCMIFAERVERGRL